MWQEDKRKWPQREAKEAPHTCAQDLHSKDVRALEQAALGGAGVTIPGGVPEPWRCGTEGRSQWAWWGWVGLSLEISELFFSLHDSVIL